MLLPGSLPKLTEVSRYVWETANMNFRSNQPFVGASAFAHKGGKRGVHTEHLGYILADMQFLQRAYPGSTW